jgi:hypothetical protein
LENDPTWGEERRKKAVFSELYAEETAREETAILVYNAAPHLGCEVGRGETEFQYRRAAFSSQLKSKVGLLLAKAGALRIN